MATVKALVIAGGGGGAASLNGVGGGGGAGGYQYDASHTVTAQAYSITVGTGGTKGINGGAGPGTGGNSVFDTITANGGGHGGTDADGQNGGSGGGGGSFGNHGGGTGSQGNNGGLGGETDVPAGSGGGGGAGGVGQPHFGGSPNCAGGIGTANSISGSSVTYCVGGAGIAEGGGSATGARDTQPGAGGGGGRGGDGSAGLDGIVIISYAANGSDGVDPVSTTGGTITTSGGQRIHTFTANGTFTVVLIPSPLTPSVSDSVTVSENFSTTIITTQFINVNQTVTITESVTLVIAQALSVFQTVTITESITVFLPYLTINVFETITITERETGLTPSTAPQVSFREKNAPYTVISSLMYAQSALGGNNLPVLGGEISNIKYFRIYNNYGASVGIATMENVHLTVWDGADPKSHSGTKSPASQSWVRIYESGFGEDFISPGLYTQFSGEDTAIGKSAIDSYIPEFGSDGKTIPIIRAGIDKNGVGFIEFATYMELPDQVGFASYALALSVIYDWHI